MTGLEVRVRKVKIVIEKHEDGYVAYPLGIEGVVVGEGDSYDDALADVKSALKAYVEAFGEAALNTCGDVLEVFLGETALGA